MIGQIHLLSRYAKKIGFAGVLLLTAHSANATLVPYKIDFFDQGFSQISNYGGGFLYDDNTLSISSFNIDMDTFGQADVLGPVPSSALNITTPPGLAFDSTLVATLSSGDLTTCINGCKLLLDEGNVFSLVDDYYSSLAKFGYYQILPSSTNVPEPSPLLLILAGGIAVWMRKKK